MNMLSAPTDIPLHCNICPKKPDFSDVKSGVDPAAKAVLDEYTGWYDKWNVQDLMSERMSQKERRRGGSGTTSLSRSNPRATTVSARNTSSRRPGTRRNGARPRTDALDPQLGRTVKGERFSRSRTPASAYPVPPTVHHHGYVPAMPTWPDMPYADSPYTIDSSIKQESMDSSATDDSYDQVRLDPPLRRPARHRNRRNFSISTESLPMDEDDVMEETIVDGARMKGVYWEGMAMFDSATPEMRRKRNQKKAFSVVQYLQATSEIVEPIEHIFDAGWRLRKSRTITGDPNDESDDESSPLEGESTPEPELPVKRKPARRNRAALAEKNVNTGRVLRGQRSSQRPTFGKPRRPYLVDEDDDLTYKTSRPKKRSGLSIHRDNSGPEITFSEPAAFNYLTAGFNNGFRHSGHGTQVEAQTQFTTLSQMPFNNNSFNHNQHLPSLCNFRPASSMMHMQTQDMGSFGGLNSQTLFQPGNSGPPLTHGHQALSAFSQQFGLSLSHVSNDSGMFQTPAQFPWDLDMYGLGTPGVSVPNNTTDTGLQAAPEISQSYNPLFLSSQQATPEDDEATISASVSDH